MPALTRDDALDAINAGDFRTLSRYLCQPGEIDRDVRIAIAEMINPDIPAARRSEKWRLERKRANEGSTSDPIKTTMSNVLNYGMPAEELYQEWIERHGHAKRESVEREIADRNGVDARTVHKWWKIYCENQKPRNQKFWHENAKLRAERIKNRK
jgi:hypothetical protein